LDNTTEQILFNESFDINYLLKLKPNLNNNNYHFNSTCDISNNSSQSNNELNNLYRNSNYNNNNNNNKINESYDNKSIDFTATGLASTTTCINNTDYLFDDFNLNCEEFQICNNNNLNEKNQSSNLFDLDDEDLDYLENNRVMDTIEFDENVTVEVSSNSLINNKNEEDVFLASNSSFNSTSSSLNATTKTTIMFNLNNYENTSCTLTKKRSPVTHHHNINHAFKCLMFRNNTTNNNNNKQKKFRTRIERSKNERKFYQRQRTSSAKISLLDLNELIKLKRNLFEDEHQINKEQHKQPQCDTNNLELIIQQLKQAASADARAQNLKLYRPSFKVEKLLNDSRGMKKYLIDYDFLMLSSSQQQQQQQYPRISKSKTISLNNLSSYNYDDLLNNVDIDDNIFIEKSVEFKQENDCFEMDYLEEDDDENVNSIKSNRCSSGYLSDY
jgi:hypothetical protein